MFPIIDKKRTGKQIRRIMEQKNITVKQLQVYLNLACVQSVYHWLEGSSMPTIDNLYAMSVLFEVSIDDMVCGNREYARVDDLRASYSRVIEYYTRLVKVA